MNTERTKGTAMTTRRPRLTYANVAATLALTLAVSMGGAYAHGKIGTNQLKNGAVTSAKIKNGHVKTPDMRRGAVNSAKVANGTLRMPDLHPSARPARVIRFTHGPHDFSTDPVLRVALPGVTEWQVQNSDWSFQVVRTPQLGNSSAESWDSPGHASAGGLTFAVAFFDDGAARAQFFNNRTSAGPVAGVRIYQTLPTTTRNAPTAPRLGRAGRANMRSVR